MANSPIDCDITQGSYYTENSRENHNLAGCLLNPCLSYRKSFILAFVYLFLLLHILLYVGTQRFDFAYQFPNLYSFLILLIHISLDDYNQHNMLFAKTKFLCRNYHNYHIFLEKTKAKTVDKLSISCYNSSSITLFFEAPPDAGGDPSRYSTKTIAVVTHVSGFPSVVRTPSCRLSIEFVPVEVQAT